MTDRKVLVHKILAAAIDLAISILAEEAPEAEEGCTHPEDARLNLTVMGGPERWYCRNCGFNYIQGKENSEKQSKEQGAQVK